MNHGYRAYSLDIGLCIPEDKNLVSPLPFTARHLSKYMSDCKPCTDYRSEATSVAFRTTLQDQQHGASEPLSAIHLELLLQIATACF